MNEACQPATMVPIHHTVIESIRRHSQLEDAKGGYEAVGFLAERDGLIVATLQLNNHASDPTTNFFVEPWEQFRGEQKLQEEGYTIVGAYHSHPTSEAIPSRTDFVMARPDSLVAIFSVVFDELRIYREDDGKLNPVEYKEA